MNTARYLTIVLVLALTGCDRTSAGRAAYAGGNYQAARDALAAEIADAGDDASAELFYDLALAELALERPAPAREAAERAEAVGGEAFAPLAAFIRGSAAYLQAEAAAEAAAQPGADARAMQWAIALGEDALAAWRFAATTRRDWPAARRNVERALLLLERLREQRKGDPNTKQKPPEPKDEPKEDDKPEEAPSTVETKALPAGKVFSVLDILGAKQRKKRVERRAARNERADVERDW